MEALLSCRLVLNLRRVSHSEPDQGFPRISAINIKELQFTSNGFLGNIGASLRDEGEDGDGVITDEGEVIACDDEVTDT